MQPYYYITRSKPIATIYVNIQPYYYICQLEKGNLDTLVKAIAGVSMSSNMDSTKPSKINPRR